jgi:hypothetical protein
MIQRGTGGPQSCRLDKNSTGSAFMRLLACLLLVLVHLPALADEIHLSNGDRISGEIKAKRGDRLIISTDYAGDVSVAWAKVMSIATTRPVEVTLQEGTATGRGVDYSGRALLSAAYARGNADSDHVHADADFTARATAYRYNVSARVDRRSEPLAGTSSAWLAGGSYDRFLDESAFAYARTSLEHDRAKDIDRRTAAGIGYGLQLLESPAASLALRGGLDYVTVERFAGARENYPAFGWGMKASFAPWGPRLEIFHEQEGFWNLEDTDVVVLRSKSGLRLPLVDGLNATAQLNVDWERQPAPGRDTTDSTLLLGVDYSF